MAILFPEERKKQRYLIYILGLIILAIFIVIKFGLIKKPSSFFPGSEIETSMPKKIEFNFKLLEDKKIEELQSFEEVKPFEGEIGRENPFLPYSTTTYSTTTKK